MNSAKTTLRDYQRSLSARLANQENRQTISKLGMRAGGICWLVELAEAGEVIPVPALLPVPLTQAWFRGIANVRGNLYTVVDFSAFVGGPATASDARSRLLLIGERYRVNAALLVESVLGLHRNEDFDSAATSEVKWSRAQRRDRHGTIWQQLDVDRLIGHAEFLRASL